jgi:hypothetical protein
MVRLFYYRGNSEQSSLNGKAIGRNLHEEIPYLEQKIEVENPKKQKPKNWPQFILFRKGRKQHIHHS